MDDRFDRRELLLHLGDMLQAARRSNLRRGPDLCTWTLSGASTNKPIRARPSVAGMSIASSVCLLIEVLQRSEILSRRTCCASHIARSSSISLCSCTWSVSSRAWDFAWLPRLR